MNMDFANTAHLTPIDFVRAMYKHTDCDGTLRLPENFGADDERDDKFDVFQMFWSRDDLNQLITEFSALYAELSAIAEVYDKLDDNEEHVGDLLDDPVLLDTWYFYLRRPQWYGAQERSLNIALEKEAQNEKLSAKEEKLLEKYRAEELEESVKNLGGNFFAYDVHMHSLRLCKLMNLGAPEIVIQNEARALIACMALKDYAAV